MPTTLDELRKHKRNAIIAIAEKHGVTGIRVFGSFARGDARPDSDLDLLIEAGPARTPFFPGGLIADLDTELGRRIDVTTKSALHLLLREQVLREAVPLGNRIGSTSSTFSNVLGGSTSTPEDVGTRPPAKSSAAIR